MDEASNALWRGAIERDIVRLIKLEIFTRLNIIFKTAPCATSFGEQKDRSISKEPLSMKQIIGAPCLHQV